MKIAISGKGGTGKTTLAANLARTFARKGHKVYAIDADPDANLASMLGISDDVTPLVQLQEVIDERVGGEGGMFTLNPEVDDVLQDYSLHHDGIEFLRMGSVKKASSACYCPENSFLRAVLNSLVFHRKETVILDMGAGIEHLTRGTAVGVDAMLVMVEANPISLETAETIEDLANQAGIARLEFVGNKIRNPQEREFLIGNLPHEPLALIEHDEGLLSLESDSESRLMLNAAEKIYDNLMEGG